MSANYRAADAAEKVGSTTRLVEFLATIGSFLLITITLPLSLCCLFKVVHEYERAVVFRMGRLKGGPRGPGKSVDRPFDSYPRPGSASLDGVAALISSRPWPHMWIVSLYPI